MLKKFRELSLHAHFRIHTGMILVGLPIFLIARSSSHGSINAGMWIGLILMAGSILWHLLFVRCPHCGSPFRLQGGIPKHCPECGKYIDKFH